MASELFKCCKSRKNLTAFGSGLSLWNRAFYDRYNEVNPCRKRISNCALRTFQRTLSEITELGAFLEGPYGETCKIANLRKWVGPELSTPFPHSLVC